MRFLCCTSSSIFTPSNNDNSSNTYVSLLIHHSFLPILAFSSSDQVRGTSTVVHHLHWTRLPSGCFSIQGSLMSLPPRRVIQCMLMALIPHPVVIARAVPNQKGTGIKTDRRCKTIIFRKSNTYSCRSIGHMRCHDRHRSYVVTSFIVRKGGVFCPSHT